MGSLVVSGMNGFLAWLAKPAVDNVFVEKKAEYLPFIALGVLAAYSIKRNLSFFQSYLMRSAGSKIVRDIRDRPLPAYYIPSDEFLRQGLYRSDDIKDNK